jgi:hypothetical protein
MCPSSIQNEWILDGVIASINDDFPAGLPNVILTSCPVTSFNIHVSTEGLAVPGPDWDLKPVRAFYRQSAL